MSKRTIIRDSDDEDEIPPAPPLRTASEKFSTDTNTSENEKTDGFVAPVFKFDLSTSGTPGSERKPSSFSGGGFGRVDYTARKSDTFDALALVDTPEDVGKVLAFVNLFIYVLCLLLKIRNKIKY